LHSFLLEASQAAIVLNVQRMVFFSCDPAVAARFQSPRRRNLPTDEWMDDTDFYQVLTNG
jgi:hypothetical protein